MSARRAEAARPRGYAARIARVAATFAIGIVSAGGVAAAGCLAAAARRGGSMPDARCPMRDARCGRRAEAAHAPVRIRAGYGRSTIGRRRTAGSPARGSPSAGGESGVACNADGPDRGMKRIRMQRVRRDHCAYSGFSAAFASIRLPIASSPRAFSAWPAPRMSRASLFWPSLHLPTSRVMSICRPTIACSIVSM